MAYDYARDSTILPESMREEYRQYAMELGRYALRVLLERGRRIIHELGHVMNGSGGHCGPAVGSCCFEIAAWRWVCSVSGRLGLPAHSGTAAASDTWTDPDFTGSGSCGDLSTSTSYVDPNFGCTLLDPGETAGTTLFATSTCTSTTYSSAYSHG